MATKKQLKLISTRNYTRAQAEEAMRDLALTTHQLEGKIAAKEEALTRVREEHDTEIQALQETEQLLLAKLNAWADKNPDAFGKKKSVEMSHGTCGYRTSPPTLKTVKNVTWKSVVPLLEKSFPDMIRVKKDVDKEAIIAARGLIGPAGLSTVGLRIEQPEIFYAEVLRDAEPGA